VEKSLIFKNSSGFKLKGILSVPEGIKELPLIISCHGFLSGKDSDTNMLLEENLNNSGAALFRFDFTAHGESGGAFEDVTVSQGADDIHSAIKMLKRLPGYNFSDIAFFATSYGGNAALWHASSHTGIKAMALKAPVSDYSKISFFKFTPDIMSEWKKKGLKVMKMNGTEFRISYNFYRDIDEHDTYEMAKNIRAKCLIIHGDDDNVVPYGQSVKLAGTIGDSAILKIRQGADHQFQQPGQLSSVMKECVKFLKTTLF